MRIGFSAKYGNIRQRFLHYIDGISGADNGSSLIHKINFTLRIDDGGSENIVQEITIKLTGDHSHDFMIGIIDGGRKRHERLLQGIRNVNGRKE